MSRREEREGRARHGSIPGDAEARRALSLGARVVRWWDRFASGEKSPRGLGVVVAGILVMASVLYGIGAWLALRLRASRRVRIAVPVVSVGNLVVGGTGKTPLVVHLARRLVSDGRTVAVVSRGYGRPEGGTVVVSRGDRPVASWERAGDEPYLIALLTKGARVVVSAKRHEAAQYAVENLGADVILLDDAYQHVQLARDLDILAVDARRPVGNGHLLPAGTLREHPLGVGRADVIVVTRCDTVGGAARVARTLAPLAPGVPIVETRMKPVELWEVGTGLSADVSSLRNGPVLALSSIAKPGDFERTLVKLDVNVAARVAFPDHHRYTDRDLEAVEDEIRGSGARAVVTTEKDAVRLSAWRPPVPVYALGIELEVTRGERLLGMALEKAISRRKRHGA